MNIIKYDFEIATIKRVGKSMSKEMEDINQKYEKGCSRVVTETGSYKVGLIRDVFSQSNYILTPDYQRRITWDNKKRSKLIESLIINIPIPPIFLYEYDYDKYEVMDGLQRLMAIIDFYKNEYNEHLSPLCHMYNSLVHPQTPLDYRKIIANKILNAAIDEFKPTVAPCWSITDLDFTTLLSLLKFKYNLQVDMAFIKSFNNLQTNQQ